MGAHRAAPLAGCRDAWPGPPPRGRPRRCGPGSQGRPRWARRPARGSARRAPSATTARTAAIARSPGLSSRGPGTPHRRTPSPLDRVSRPMKAPVLSARGSTRVRLSAMTWLRPPRAGIAEECIAVPELGSILSGLPTRKASTPTVALPTSVQRSRFQPCTIAWTPVVSEAGPRRGGDRARGGRSGRAPPSSPRGGPERPGPPDRPRASRPDRACGLRGRFPPGGASGTGRSGSGPTRRRSSPAPSPSPRGAGSAPSPRWVPAVTDRARGRAAAEERDGARREGEEDRSREAPPPAQGSPSSPPAPIHRSAPGHSLPRREGPVPRTLVGPACAIVRAGRPSCRRRRDPQSTGGVGGIAGVGDRPIQGRA